jgi:hypothetical protein
MSSPTRTRHPATAEILQTLTANWRIVAVGTMLSTMTTVTFYTITAYTPTFGSAVLHLAAIDNLIVTLCVGLANFILLPTMGALSGRIGSEAGDAGVYGHGSAHRISRHALAGRRAVVREADGGGALVCRALCQLQRRHGGVSNRAHAGRSQNGGLLAGLQSGDGDLRRIHAGHLHLVNS